jgi:heme/copper-type cytochrome/quinol oxidase subunit 2
MLYLITITITLAVLFFAVWNFKKNAKDKPQSSVVTTLAIFVFLILILMVLKTYNDYQLYIAITQRDTNVEYALLTDVLVLIIGGCILYLKNFMYLDSVKEEKIRLELKEYQADSFRKKENGDNIK